MWYINIVVSKDKAKAFILLTLPLLNSYKKASITIVVGVFCILNINV